MNTQKAIEICEQWFAYLDKQREHSKTLAEAATLARKGFQIEAKNILRKVDNEKRLVVFDGAYLEPAVKHLTQLHVRSSEDE